MQSADDFAQALEIISGRYYFAHIKRPDCLRSSHTAAENICYCIDTELVYEPFYSDFGPLNLGKTYRFCETTKHLLQEAEKRNKKLYLFCGAHANQKANAAVLVGIYQVLYLDRSPEEAYRHLRGFEPYTPFRDPSCGSQTFNLQVEHVVRGMHKARLVGLISTKDGSWKFNLQEYETYEQVENGDLNWIVPNKFVAFSGPAAQPNRYVGFREMVPEDYWEYFRSRGVKAIIRLNKKVYEGKRFTDGGFVHHEMYFPDGSCPTESILRRFLDTVEAEPGAFAVHCKAGLGRTGVLICCYMMKHFRFTAEEVIGYIRVVRPGSVIGPQQNFLHDMQARMWAEGDLMRQRQAAAAAAAATPPTPAPKLLSKAGTSSLWAADHSSPSTPTAADDRIGAYYPSSSPQQASRPQRPGAVDAAQLSTRLGTMQLQQPTPAYRTSSSGTGNARSSSTSRRSNTPQRQNSAGLIVTSAPATPAAAARATSGTSILLQGRPGTTGASARHAPLSAPAGRSASTDRSRDRVSGGGSVALAAGYSPIGSLRTSLHAEPAALATRAKTLPERVSQSAQFLSNLMSLNSSQQHQQQQQEAKSGVARVLAPNGQPRKVSAALLSAAGGLNSAAALSALVDMEAQPGAGLSSSAVRSRNAWSGR